MLATAHAPEFIDQANVRLADRRRELFERLQRAEEELDALRDPDVEERATERELDEVLEAEGRAGLAEIAAIDAAIGRIVDGTYGTCAQCGETILKERLEAVPHAALCRVCARSV